MINYTLLFLSVAVNAAYSSVYNFIGKNRIRNITDNYSINMGIYSAAAVLMLIMLAFVRSELSVFTILLGILFGIVTAFGGIFKLKALTYGPMSFTILIVTSSMIIPAFSGALIWNEEISLLKILGTVLMITAAYFTAVKDGGKTSLKWIVYTMSAFLCAGSVGVLQKFQQKSQYADENIAFLTVAFAAAAFVCFICRKCTLSKPKINTEPSDFKKSINPALVCGIFIVFLNTVNLYLSGVLPSAFMFPVQNGGTTVLSVLSAILIFKEQLNRRRTIGLVIGMTALLMLIL